MLPPAWWRRVIRLGDSGPDVDLVRRKLLIPAGEKYDHVMAAYVRGYQHENSLPTTGEVDEATAHCIGDVAYLHRPDWFDGPKGEYDTGYTDYLAHTALEDADAVRRYRTTNGLELSDLIDDDVLDAMSVWYRA